MVKRDQVMDMMGNELAPEPTFWQKFKNFFCPAPKFSLRRSAIRKIDENSPPPLRERLLALLSRESLLAIVQKAQTCFLHRLNLLLAQVFLLLVPLSHQHFDYIIPPRQFINWLDRNLVTVEIANRIIMHALPDPIVLLDGRFSPPLYLLRGVNSRINDEINWHSARGWGRSIVLRFSSITALVNGLDIMPDGCLSRFQNLTIEVEGPYNGHANVHGSQGFHRGNVCPNRFVFEDGGEAFWFEMEFACKWCEHGAFYDGEYRYACAAILSKVGRLMNINFQADYDVFRKTVGHRWVRDFDPDVSSVYAIKFPSKRPY